MTSDKYIQALRKKASKYIHALRKKASKYIHALIEKASKYIHALIEKASKYIQTAFGRVCCFIEFAKKHNLHLYLGVILLAFYCILEYGGSISQWYNTYIVDKYLSKVVSNIPLQILMFLLVVISGYDIYQKTINTYRYDERFLFLIAFFSILILCYRCCESSYEYLSWLGGVSYVDILALIGIGYIASFIRNFIRLAQGDKGQNDNERNPQRSFSGGILHDCPITRKDEDIFDFEDDISKIESIIRASDRSKTWSLAITAQWGAGKTSFMNLITKKLEESKDKLEIMYFNPRASKSIDTIQEDFFSQLMCVLSRYDSRCSHTMKDYMSSLQLIDNRGIIEKVISFYRIWNKVDLKEKIKTTTGSIPKRILVLIDDFDRLSREEILEVLKLIDNNAAFPNMIFITAYDKGQINKYFGEVYNTLDTCFVDKFFNSEFAIPLRPYSYIGGFIKGKLYENIEKVNKEEKGSIEVVFEKHLSLFQRYVPTLRDAKRFVNQFLSDYSLVRGHVIIDEFMLVQLAKYRYPEEYKRMHKKEFIEDGPSYHLKDDVLKDLNILPILERLFRKKGEKPEDLFGHIFDPGHIFDLGHIFDPKSFERYFVNGVYRILRIREMNEIFQEDKNVVFARIDSWLEDKTKSNDIIDYLINKRVYDFVNNQNHKQYAIAVAYISIKRPEGRAPWLLFNLDTEAYKNSILDVILNKEYDNNRKSLRNLHRRCKIEKLDEGKLLITDNDIWKVIQEEFLELASKSEDEKNLIEWLHDCIDPRKERTGESVLDADCLKAYREHVMKKPNYYIEHFVRPKRTWNSPDYNSVACEPFWEQIFGDKASFKKFLEVCTQQSIPRIELVNNFWRLYEANEMKPIMFEGRGNVQEKIDSNLVNEVNLLAQMEGIEKQVDKISSSTPSPNLTTRLNQLLKDLDQVNLHISLKGEIRDQIEKLLKSY